MKQYDYLMVGSGLFGVTMARALTDAGKRVLVLEKRDHLAGNCHTPVRDGILVHQYGAHVFHTNSKRVWDYVQRFAHWIPHMHRGRAMIDGRIFSFPVNLLTLNQLHGEIRTPADAKRFFDEQCVPATAGATDLESYALAKIGREVYSKFIEGYTLKQWGRDPRSLPSMILRRLPVRTENNDNYFEDTYQGQPAGGFTHLVERMIEGIDYELAVDFNDDRERWRRLAHTTIYSGPLDQLYDYELGKLEYRSLKWEWEGHERDIQGCAVMHYPDRKTPYTKVIEHKFFHPCSVKHSIVSREIPQEYDGTNEPFYPINLAHNDALADRYRRRATADGYVTGGRLGSYRYFDMDQVIAQALVTSEKLLRRTA